MKSKENTCFERYLKINSLYSIAVLLFSVVFWVLYPLRVRKEIAIICMQVIAIFVFLGCAALAQYIIYKVETSVQDESYFLFLIKAEYSSNGFSYASFNIPPAFGFPG